MRGRISPVSQSTFRNRYLKALRTPRFRFLIVAKLLVRVTVKPGLETKIDEWSKERTRSRLYEYW